MKVYTSYFANSKKLAMAGVTAICISLYRPRYMVCKWYRLVAPSHSILYDTHSHEEYTSRFKNEILANLDANKVYDDLKMLSDGHDIALCCYEKPGDFCHRHIVADWLNEKLGLGVVEFGQPKKQEYVQGDLFGSEW